MKNLRNVMIVCGLISMTVAATSLAAASSKRSQTRVAQVTMDDENAHVSTIEVDDDMGVTITVR